MSQMKNIFFLSVSLTWWFIMVGAIQAMGSAFSSIVIDAGPTKELTCAEQRVRLEGSISGNTGPVSIQWTTLEGRITSSDAIINPEVARAGTYTLTVTDLNTGASFVDSVTITSAKELPVINIVPPGELNCLNDRLRINYNIVSDTSMLSPNVLWSHDGTGSYDNSPGNFSPGKFVTVVNPALYFVEIFVPATGCIVRDTVPIRSNLDTLEAVVLGETLLNCGFECLSLNAQTLNHLPSTSYEWIGPNGLTLPSDSSSLTACEPGDYVLVVTHPTSFCTSQQSFVIEKDVSAPVIFLAETGSLNCAQPSLRLDATASSQGVDFQILWDTNVGNIVSGAASYRPWIDEPGMYYVTLVNTRTLCSSVDSISISGDFTRIPPILGKIDTLNCINATTAAVRLLNTPSSSVEYGWYTASGNLVSSFSNLTQTAVFQGGNYFVVSLNTANGCRDTAYFEVPQFRFQPTVLLGPDPFIDCSGNAVVLDASASAFETPSTFEWLNFSGQVLETGSLTYSTNLPGVYRFRITDEKSKCTQTGQIIVRPDTNAPNIDAGSPQTLTCALRSVVLQGQILDNLNNYQVEWSSPTGNEILGNPSSLSPMVNTPGLYVMKVTNLDNQCLNTSSVVVDEDVEEPIAEAGQPITFNCEQAFITLTGQTNIAQPIVEWTTVGGAFANSTQSLSTQIIQPGVYTIKVTNPETGCYNSSFVVVRAPENFPVIDAGKPKTLTCIEEIVELSGTSNITNNLLIEWTGPGIVDDNNQLITRVETEGTYYLAVTNLANDCRALDSVVVTINKEGPEMALVFPTYHQCDNANVGLLVGQISGGTPPYLYEIVGITSPDPSNSFEDLDAGIPYDLRITDAGGCEYTQSFTIDSIGLSQIQFPENLTIAPTQKGGIAIEPTWGSMAPNQLSFDWSPKRGLSCYDCPNPTANPDKSTLYTLVISDDQGCTRKISLWIFLAERESVFFPNAFSPNGDNINDFFHAFGDIAIVNSVDKLTIYDRLGGAVWQGRDLSINQPNMGWDGTFKGKALPPGVFTYLAEVKFLNGEIKIYSGDVTLLR
jgi:gliding motility-associated-like protein